jgi:hypothetical protein
MTNFRKLGELLQIPDLNQNTVLRCFRSEGWKTGSFLPGTLFALKSFIEAMSLTKEGERK